jgi:hypothetical protein
MDSEVQEYEVRLIGTKWLKEIGESVGNIITVTGTIMADAINDPYTVIDTEDYTYFLDPRSQAYAKWGAYLVREENTNPVDNVNHPAHYIKGGMEVIDVIEAFDLDVDAYLKDAVKYILRHKAKGTPYQDIAKARWYLDRWLQRNNNLKEKK